MAISTCVKCGGSRFELKENEPYGSRYKLMFVQCTNCGGVVGAVDFFNTGAELQVIKKHLGIS